MPTAPIHPIAAPSCRYGSSTRHACVPSSTNFFQRHVQYATSWCRPLHVNHSALCFAHGFSNDADDNHSSMDRNQLYTTLNAAIAAEDYALASRIRDALSSSSGLDPTVIPADWHHLGIVEWLADRAESLGFRVPTEVQRRASMVISDHCDCVIESETGSGKTLAFLLPALSLLPYPPDVYPEDLPGPALVVVVPTRELGVQLVMLTYKLFGGSVNFGIPGERANMFRYHGPRGLKVRGLLLPEEVESSVHMRYLAGSHVVVGTPDLLSQSMERGVEVMQHCQVFVVDELDACFHEHHNAMHFLMDAAMSGYSTSTLAPQVDQPPDDPSNAPTAPSNKPQIPRARPTVALVGATIDDNIIQEAAAAGWIQDPVRVAVGSRMRPPSGLHHRYILTDPTGRIGAMCRQLRSDLRDQNPDAAPARVMLFSDDESQARALAEPLRTVLWGEHSISVLLPGGAEPIKALHSFRDNQTSLLIATPGAARGLDLPAVTHVYNVSPPKEETEYIHRAGRAGRIGAPVPGTVTTMVTPGELPGLLVIAEHLGIKMEEVEALGPPTLAAPSASGDEDGLERDIGDVDEMKRALEVALALSPQDDNEKGKNGRETEEE